MKTEFFRAEASRFDNLAAKPFGSEAAATVGFINAVVKKGEVDSTSSLLVCGACGVLKQLQPEVVTVRIKKDRRIMVIFRAIGHWFFFRIFEKVRTVAW